MTSIPLTPLAARDARQWLGDSPIHMSAEVRDTTALLLSELVTNSVAHSGLGPHDEVEITIKEVDGGLRAEVIDNGGGIPSNVSAKMGFRVIEAVADAWGYSNDPTTVWFELLAGPSREP